MVSKITNLLIRKLSFKKRIPIHIFILMGFICTFSGQHFGTTAWAASMDPYPPDILRIKERGKLIVTQFNGERPGFFMYDEKNDFPDYISYNDNGRRLIGYDVEIAHKIAQRLGVDLEIQRHIKSFNELCRATAKDEADIAISKVTITMTRGQYVNFSDPYVVLRIALLINRMEEMKTGRKGDNIFQLINSSDVKIAVQRGTSWVPFGKDLFPNAQLVECPNMDAALSAVEKGETLAFLNDEWNIASKLKIRPDLTVRVRLAFVPGVKSGIAMAVSPKNRNLLSFLNLMVERDRLKTTPDELLSRYFAKGSAEAVANAMAAAERVEKEIKTPIVPFTTILIIFIILLGIWTKMAVQKNKPTFAQ